MKKILTLAILFYFLIPFSAHGADWTWVYVHDGDFAADFSLVERTDGIHNGDLYLVDLGICTDIQWVSDKWVLWSGGMFLSGIGDDFLDPESGEVCNVWDAFELSDWEMNMTDYEEKQFLQAVYSD